MKVFWRFELPSRSYFSKKLTQNIYDEVHGIIKLELESAEFYAGTTDMWSSRTTDPYMSFTVHWIDDEFNYTTRSLQVRIHWSLISFISNGKIYICYHQSVLDCVIQA